MSQETVPRYRARSLPLLLLLLALGSALALVVPVWAATAPKTTRVSISSRGVEADGESGGGGISADGRFVAFESAASNLVKGDRNDLWDVFVRDRKTGRTTRVSVSSAGTEANTDGFVGQGSLGGPISANGRFVAFISDASNL